MAVGGCFCGKVRIEYSGQPIATALCHCLDCRKLTGSLYTYDFIIKTTDLKVTGSPKEVAKTSDSGNPIKNYFCSDCGTPLYGVTMKSTTGEPDDTVVLRAGILDDIEVVNQLKPQVEIYTDRRVRWVSPAEGADQFTGMLPIPESGVHE